eukprot:8080163-Prorocentrum_lima.AAC.1
MTSSLVGSEMCIRDRSLVYFNAKSSDILSLDDRQQLGYLQFPYASMRVPVSYTHLTLPTICSV